MSDAWMTRVCAVGVCVSIAVTIYIAYDGFPWWFTGVVGWFAGLWAVSLVRRLRAQRQRRRLLDELRDIQRSMEIEVAIWDEVEAMQRRRGNDG